MLAFDDAGMARVMIAGTGVAPADRSAWLADLAHRLEQPALAPSTMRTRRWRKRDQDGLVRLPVVIDEALLAVGLVSRGLLDPVHADDKAAMAAAATKALTLFCEDGDASPHDAAIKDKLRAEFFAVIRKRTNARLSSSNPTRARATKGRQRS